MRTRTTLAVGVDCGHFSIKLFKRCHLNGLLTFCLNGLYQIEPSTTSSYDVTLWQRTVGAAGMLLQPMVY